MLKSKNYVINSITYFYFMMIVITMIELLILYFRNFY